MIHVEKVLLWPSVYEDFNKELATQITIEKPLKDILKRKTHYIVMKCKNLMFSYIPIKGITQNRMKKLMKRLLTIADRFNITREVKYWFLLCDLPRVFPLNGEIFDVKHINGAYIYRNTKDVYIYRIDDFEKVAIHELLHASSIDKDSNDILLRSAFNIENNTFVNEAVIEAWAVMLYLSFYSIEHKIPFIKLLNNELKRSLSLSHQLLKYQEKYFPLWKEKTPAYSYIRFKTCILYYWDIFNKYNDPVAFLIDYNGRDDFIKKIRSSNLNASLTMGLK